EPTPVRAMAPMSAALALATAGLAEEGIEGRRRAAAVWWRSLPEGPWTVPHVLEGGSGSYLRFPLVTSEAAIRDRLVSLLERFGAARGYPAALCDIEPARAIVAPTQQRALEGARLLAARLFTLPTHSFVGKRDQRPVLEALASL
ncbi:MAG: DegT/DnrJ/EryC1/StrS family aminotransferase, partial [Gemmatimonadota bacterium]